MAITDLTNTTWYIPAGWQGAHSYGTFNIESNLSANTIAIGCQAIDKGDFSLSVIGKTNNIACFLLSGGIPIAGTEANYSNDVAITLNITGGADVTNSSLISWLETNGTQLKVDNLTDTTWNVPAGWEAEAGYGEFDLIGTCNHDGYDDSLSPFCIGYYIDFKMFSLKSLANSIVCNSNPDSIVSSDNFILTIEGGTDVTNPKLIAWLSKYGELQGAEEPTPTKKFTRLFLGAIAHTSNGKRFRKLQITAPIKFTISGTEYQAEPSMTFGEWLESGYNTDGLYTKTITSGGAEYNPIIIAEDGDAFTVAEAKGAVIEIDTPITADFGYTTVTLTQDSALQAGLYDANDNLVASWDELVNTYGMNPTISYSSSSSSSTYYKTCKTSPYYVLTKNSKLSSGVKLVIGNIGTSIPSRLFFECEQLTDIIVPEGVKTLSSYCFGQCAGLKNITLPNTITSISTYVFYYCDNLLELTIPDGVTKLSNQMCIYCESLKSVVIPSTVTSIGTQTFSWCYDLGDITFKGTVRQWNSITFDTSWKQSVPATQVVCSDGTVTL